MRSGEMVGLKWSDIDLVDYNNSEITTLEEHIKKLKDSPKEKRDKFLEIINR